MELGLGLGLGLQLRLVTRHQDNKAPRQKDTKTEIHLDNKTPRQQDTKTTKTPCRASATPPVLGTVDRSTDVQRVESPVFGRAEVGTTRRYDIHGHAKEV